MNADAQQLRSQVRKLSTRLYFLSIRQGARRVLDQLRFGDGKAERLAAAAVLGSVLFLLAIGISIVSSAPLAYGLAAAGSVLFIAWATSAFFVFGPTDEHLQAEHKERSSDLLNYRQDLAQAEAEEEEERLAEEEEREERRGSRARRRNNTVKCFYCEGLIPRTAIKCRHCGEILDERYRPKARQSFYPLAAFLSWLFPGLGQMSKGQFGRGVLWILAEFVGYLCCIVPGVVIHVIGIFDAAIYSE